MKREYYTVEHHSILIAINALRKLSNEIDKDDIETLMRSHDDNWKLSHIKFLLDKSRKTS